MKQLILHQFEESPFAETVRLALRGKGLDFQTLAVPVLADHAPSRAQGETGHLRLENRAAKRMIVGASPILRYLEELAPQPLPLFPGDAATQRAIYQQLVELDSQLGIPARRLACIQMLLEAPRYLAQRLLPFGSWLAPLPLVGRLAGHAAGVALAKRFDLHLDETHGVYESTEAYLLALARRLEGQAFVMGAQFSAADLALAAQLRPLRIVPCFAEQPALAPLFVRAEQILREHGAPSHLPYEQAIAEVRRHAAPIRRRLRHRVTPASPYRVAHWQTMVCNDQRPILTWRLVYYPWHYWVSLRRNKVRHFSESDR